MSIDLIKHVSFEYLSCLSFLCPESTRSSGIYPRYAATLVCTSKGSARWVDNIPDEFSVRCGVKQGSLSSPHLFNLYVNNLPNKLNKHKVGSIVNDQLINHLIYADDTVVLNPSLIG